MGLDAGSEADHPGVCTNSHSENRPFTEGALAALAVGERIALQRGLGSHFADLRTPRPGPAGALRVLARVRLCVRLRFRPRQAGPTRRTTTCTHRRPGPSRQLSGSWSRAVVGPTRQKNLPFPGHFRSALANGGTSQLGLPGVRRRAKASLSTGDAVRRSTRQHKKPQA